MMLSVSFSMPELLIAPPPLEAELPERVLSETETVPKLQMAPPPYHSWSSSPSVRRACRRCAS